MPKVSYSVVWFDSKGQVRRDPVGEWNVNVEANGKPTLWQLMRPAVWAQFPLELAEMVFPRAFGNLVTHADAKNGMTVMAVVCCRQTEECFSGSPQYTADMAKKKVLSRLKYRVEKFAHLNVVRYVGSTTADGAIDVCFEKLVPDMFVVLEEVIS